ncbi:MAG: response regulator transcription factor [Chloroflexi bacterium]|nr:MAG: response regulator transcription factor [Chloroflexota bacterium]
MNSLNGAARVLLIADDREKGKRYHDALASGGYAVTQAESFVEALGTPGLDPDVIVLCELAVFSYPAQTAQVLRVSAEMTPAALVAEVHRRVALRAALYATIAQAA